MADLLAKKIFFSLTSVIVFNIKINHSKNNPCLQILQLLINDKVQSIEISSKTQY